MSVLDDKFIGISSGTVLFYANGDANLLVRKPGEDDQPPHSFTLNASGEKIVRQITGSEKWKDFPEQFCAQYRVSAEKNRDWIVDFLKLLVSRGVIVLSEEPIPDGRIAVAGDESLTTPLSVTVEVTERCNLRCRHCYLEACPERESTISYADFARLADTLAKNNVCTIELTGGELFTHPQCVEILRLCYRKFATVGILTNGTLVPEEAVRLMGEHRAQTMVNVSIDYPDAERHDAFRGRQGAWEASCRTIRLLSEAGVFVRMASVILPDNMWGLEKLAELALSLGAKVFNFSYVETFGRGEEMTQLYNGVDGLEYGRYINKVVEQYRELIPVIQHEEHERKIVRGNCGAGTKSVVLGADGALRPCALSPKIAGMGNALTEDYPEIFRRGIYQKLREIPAPHPEHGCDPDCRWLYACRGCFVRGFHNSAALEQPCGWIRQNGLEELSRLFRDT